MRFTTTSICCLLALGLVAGDAEAGSQTRPARPQTAPAERSGRAMPTRPHAGGTELEGAETESSPDALSQVRAYIEKIEKNGELDRSMEGWESLVPEFPHVEFQEGEEYYWHLKTSLGPIVVRFFPDVAPNHVANFLYLTELGFFDDTLFFRISPKFAVQGGDPTGTGLGEPGYYFCGELDPEVKHDRRGLLSMANRGSSDCTDSSLFFFTLRQVPWLDGEHTIFGEIVEGMKTLDEIEKRGHKTGRPTENVVLEKATVSKTRTPTVDSADDSASS